MNTYNYIIAQSWNGTWFYYNVFADTWVMADYAELSHDYNASQSDMAAAKVCAHREKFAAINITLDAEVSL